MSAFCYYCNYSFQGGRGRFKLPFTERLCHSVAACMAFSASCGLLGKARVGRVLMCVQERVWGVCRDAVREWGSSCERRGAVSLLRRGLGTLGQVLPFLRVRLAGGSMMSKNRYRNIDVKLMHVGCDYLQQLEMAEHNEEQEIEEPENVIEEPREQPTDHIPLKDEFSSDLSEIDIVEMAERQEELPSQRVVDSRPKRKKIVKNYRWKNQWIKVPNVIAGSAPILQKRWVKVKYVPTEEELAAFAAPDPAEKDNNALEMAQAIIQGQLSNQ